MKILALLALFAMMAPKDYTAHVHFTEIHLYSQEIGRSKDILDTSGHGNLRVIEADKPDKNYSFTFTHCTSPDKEKRKKSGDSPARWKNANELIVLFPSDDSKGDECTLKLKPIEKQ